MTRLRQGFVGQARSRKTYAFILLFFITTLHPQLTITSNHALCAPNATGYHFIHAGNVHIKSPLIGELSGSLLTLSLSGSNPDNVRLSKAIIRNVTLKRKNSILTAQRLIMDPQAQTAHAYGSVQITRTLSTGSCLETHASHARLNLATNRIDTWGVTPVTTTIKYEHKNKTPLSGTSTKDRRWRSC